MAFIPKELVGILTSVSQGDLLLRDIDAYRILIQNHYITNFNENPNELNDINSDDLKQVTDKMLNKMKSKEKRVGWKRESTKEFDSKVGNLINDIVQLPSTTRDPFYIYLLSNFNSEAFHLMRAKYPTLFSMFHDTMCSGGKRHFSSFVFHF